MSDIKITIADSAREFINANALNAAMEELPALLSKVYGNAPADVVCELWKDEDENWKQLFVNIRTTDTVEDAFVRERHLFAILEEHPALNSSLEKITFNFQ